jgi:hypothetical protein
VQHGDPQDSLPSRSASVQIDNPNNEETGVLSWYSMPLPADANGVAAGWTAPKRRTFSSGRAKVLRLALVWAIVLSQLMDVVSTGLGVIAQLG